MNFQNKKFYLVGSAIILAGLFFGVSASPARAGLPAEALAKAGECSNNEAGISFSKFFNPLVSLAEKVAKGFGYEVALAIAIDPDNCGSDTYVSATNPAGNPCTGSAVSPVTINWNAALSYVTWMGTDALEYYDLYGYVLTLGGNTYQTVSPFYTVSSGLTDNTTYAWSVEAYYDTGSKWGIISYQDWWGAAYTIDRPSGSFTTSSCACIDTSWSPDPSTICSGESFTQTSNCGNTRTSTGTKYCPPTCTPNGCNGNCPAGCTVAQDPDCGCQGGNSCCAPGCTNANDSDCPAGCACGDWSNQGCGAGGCAITQMYQIRSCNPSGCAAQSQCVADPSCGGGPLTCIPSCDGCSTSCGYGYYICTAADCSTYYGALCYGSSGCVLTCGDGICNGSETCSTCAGDCGACTPTCTPSCDGCSGGPCGGTGTQSCTNARCGTYSQSCSMPACGYYALTVTKSGTGSGTVTSAPSGINCGATCSASYTSGTSVTLTASAASGSIFAGWSGEGCSGTGTCIVPMTQARSVTATFNTSVVPDPTPDASCSTGSVFADVGSLGGSLADPTVIEKDPVSGKLIIAGRNSVGDIWAKELNDVSGTTVAREWYVVSGNTTSRPKLVKIDGQLWLYVIGGSTVWKLPYSSFGNSAGWINLGISSSQFGNAGPGAITASSGTYRVTGLNPIILQKCVSNNASCVGITAPDSVTTSQSFSATVTMGNTGTKPWTTDSSPHNLGSQNLQDNLRWGLNRVGLPSSPINSGQSATFNFTATAPTTPGTYPFDWKMVEDGVEWFGATCTKNITVAWGGGGCSAGQTNPHSECVSGFCTAVSSCGVSDCSSCGGGGCSAGQTNPHSECISNSCTAVSSCGVSDCSSCGGGVSRFLTVTKSGTGSGTVTSAPAGINCGSDCTENYTSGASVTLNTSAASGSTFAGWTGDADCTDGIVTMSATKSCIATFNLIPSDFSLNNSGSIYATIVKGQSGVSTETTITVIPLYGFSSNVVLSVQSVSPSLSSGSTFSFTPSTLTSAQYSSGSKFKVNIGSGLTASKTYTIVVQGVDSSHTTTVYLNVVVKQPGWIEF